MTTLRKISYAAWLQVRLQLLFPANFVLTSVLFPVMYTVVFLLIFQHLGRSELNILGVIAPALMGVWMTAVGITAAIIDDERWNGGLEALVALPGNAFFLTLLGRTLASSTMSLIAFAASWLVAKVVFNAPLTGSPPLTLIGVVFLTVLAAAGVAIVVGSFLVLSRVAIQFQTTLTFPFFLLGGIAFPVTLLPEFIVPLSYVNPLYWSAQSLYGILEDGPYKVGSWIFLLISAAFYLAVGFALLGVVTRRARQSGRMGYA